MKTYLTILFSFTSIYLSAQNPELQEFLSYSFPYNLTASSSEGKVVWVENKEGVRNIFYAEAPDYQPTQLTPYDQDDGQDLSQMVFSPDHTTLYYVRGGAPNRSGEYPNPTSNPDGYEREIYALDLETNFPKKFTTGSSPVPIDTGIIFLDKGNIKLLGNNSETSEVLFKVRGGIGNLRLSPNRTQLAFVNGRGDHSYIGVYDLGAKTLKFLSPSVDQDDEPVWSPDGQKIAFLRFPHETFMLFSAVREALPFSVMVADVESGKATEIWKAEEGMGSAFRSISANDQLFWMADGNLVFPYEKTGWTHLYAVSPSGGSARPLMTGEFEVQFVSQSPDKTKIIYSSNQDDINRQHVWEVTSSGSPKKLTNEVGVQWSPVVDGAGNLIFLSSTGTRPADVWKIVEGKSTPITTESDYPSDKLVEPQPVIFSSADGMKIHGQLFLPKGHKSSDKRAAVMFLHGGSRRQMLLGFHHRGYYHNNFAMNQYMASKGYVVLAVNYRSGIGYGMHFREAENYGATGASEFNDVLGAGLYLQNYPGVDPEKVGLWGGSYGGYLTALGLARASDLFAAGVDIHGVTDWNVVIKGFVPSYNKLEVPEFAELAYNSSPIAFMDGWKSPVLLIHGDDDRNVPFSETVDKAEALRKQGVYFEQLIFPDEVHGFLLHKNWFDAYDATYDFFERMLKK